MDTGYVALSTCECLCWLHLHQSLLHNTHFPPVRRRISSWMEARGKKGCGCICPLYDHEILAVVKT